MALIQSLITVVVFVVMLGGLVLVHEVGHFVTARLARVRVLEFGIGFPPRAKVLANRGETLYSLNWLPIGGFVKLEGEDGDDSGDPRSFQRSPLITKLIILLAGVLMNLLVAFLIFFAIAWLFTPDMGVRVGEVETDSPAQAAGIQTGDEILSVDGREYEFFGTSILEGIRSSAGKTVTLAVRRDGRVQPVTVTLRQPAQVDQTHGTLGIRGSEGVHTGSYLTGRPVLAAAAIGVEQTQRALSLILGGLGKLAQDIATDPTTAPSASGPIGIGVQTGNILWGLGPVFTLYFAGLLSANLALVNILPFPPLDGGRMLVIVLKAVVGNKLSVQAERLTYLVGFALLFAFLIWITAFDIARLGGVVE
jgi:regulator of sigma E protease